MRGHGSQEDVRGAAQSLHPHALASEIRDTADAIIAEQLKAARMHTRQDRDWLSGIDRNHERRREVQAEVDLVVCNRSRLTNPGVRREYLMSTNPSRRRNSSATYWGAMQVPLTFDSLTAVVSGRGSWPSELEVVVRPAAPAAESVARKRRRFCIICMI